MARKRPAWNPVRLAALSLTDLVALRAAVEADPASANPAHATGSIYLYTPQARRKLDAISWAVYHRTNADRASRASGGSDAACTTHHQGE